MSNTTEQRDFSLETLTQLKDLLAPSDDPTSALDIVQNIADNDGLAILDRMPRTARNELFDNIRKFHDTASKIVELEQELAATEGDGAQRQGLIDEIEYYEIENLRTDKKCVDIIEPIAKRVIGA